MKLVYGMSVTHGVNDMYYLVLSSLLKFKFTVKSNTTMTLTILHIAFKNNQMIIWRERKEEFYYDEEDEVIY